MTERRKRSSSADGEAGADPNGWMTTFSDLLTLMLTFFVLLISMSSMDDRALRSTFGFFNDALGVLNKVASVEVTQAALMPVSELISNEVFAELEGVRREVKGQKQQMTAVVERIIDELNLEHMLQARPDRDGLVITVAAHLLFDPDGTRLKKDAAPILAALGDLLSSPQLHLAVEGRQSTHKDGIDPWELASERALSVAQHLIVAEKVDQTRLAVAGYGPDWPEESLPGENEKLNLVLRWTQETAAPEQKPNPKEGNEP